MKKIFNWKIALILVILLASFLRLWQLGNIPAGTPDDEASYIYNSYSIWHTGRDILGNFLPLSFNAHSSQSPVEVYLTAPFVGLLGLSLFSARLPAALLGIGSVFLIFLITDLLFKNERLSVISAFLLSISPWALQINRGLWDSDFALFFFMLATYIFIKYINSKKFIWSIVPFFLAFYSYHGFKVFYLFLIPLLVFLFRKELLVRKTQLIIFIAAFVFTIGSFIFVMQTQSITRQSQVSLLSDPKAVVAVNWERQFNNAPLKIQTLFSNKALYFLTVVRENYLEPFSTNFLFLYGDTNQGSLIDNIFFRGELYIIEFPLLLLGAYMLLKNKDEKVRNLLLALLFLSPLPSAFTVDKNFVLRDITMLPVLLIIVALGFNYLLNKIYTYKKVVRFSLLAIFAFIYIFLFSEYFYQYYYRWSVYGAEGWQVSYKNLIKIIDSKKDYNVYVSGKQKEFLVQYAIFEKKDPAIIQKIWNNDVIKIDNLTLMEGCLAGDDLSSVLPNKSIYARVEGGCNYKDTPIQTIYDSKEILKPIWNIYEKN